MEGDSGHLFVRSKVESYEANAGTEEIGLPRYGESHFMQRKAAACSMFRINDRCASHNIARLTTLQLSSSVVSSTGVSQGLRRSRPRDDLASSHVPARPLAATGADWQKRYVPGYSPIFFSHLHHVHSSAKMHCVACPAFNFVVGSEPDVIDEHERPSYIVRGSSGPHRCTLYMT